MQSCCFASCPEAYALSLRSFHLPEEEPRAPLLLRPPTSLASVRWSSRAVWFRVLLALSLLVKEGARQIVAVSSYCGAHLETFAPVWLSVIFGLTKLWLCANRQICRGDGSGFRSKYRVRVEMQKPRRNIRTKPPRMPLAPRSTEIQAQTFALPKRHADNTQSRHSLSCADKQYGITKTNSSGKKESR
ncbi:hypothetical protein F5144DRAFT_336875 [Chaetomium tenue]|uniref:Uncharacterized protein n=1 Tax=Chaetomium tenue TaxID=1854479 RepID=A0ACB7NYP8_9PEZI|nr:hypothetical protein F5144DRAFT_336875 [Chaetomium globosum]